MKKHTLTLILLIACVSVFLAIYQTNGHLKAGGPPTETVQAGLQPSAAPTSDQAPDPAAGLEEAGPSVGSCEIEPGPLALKARLFESLSKYVDKVGKGESLSVVLERLGLSGREARRVIEAAKEVMDLTKIRPGTVVTLFRDRESNLPVRVDYQRKGTPRLIMYKTPAGYAASWERYEPITCVTATGGTIKSTLWGTAVKVHQLDPGLVMDFADIFRYDVDFLTEVQSGDSFTMLYEQQFSQGEPAGSGRILAAEFINKGQRVKAFYHQGPDGQGGYYDENGQSLQKMFLKSPLQYRRISSHFTHARKHPILKIVRPHLGVDYAAPTGTPVEAIGDGTITFLGRKGGYGNFIIIQHNKTYETYYAHLSKYANGLKKGSKVKQGQLIGYVGSTGLSTGPHLDFRVKENGKFIDPLSVKLKPAPPITAQDKPKFQAQVAEWQNEMVRQMAARKTAAD